MRSLRHRLPRAWDSLASWALELPVRSRIPIPEPIRDVSVSRLRRESKLHSDMWMMPVKDAPWSCFEKVVRGFRSLASLSTKPHYVLLSDDGQPAGAARLRRRREHLHHERGGGVAALRGGRVYRVGRRASDFGGLACRTAISTKPVDGLACRTGKHGKNSASRTSRRGS